MMIVTPFSAPAQCPGAAAFARYGVNPAQTGGTASSPFILVNPRGHTFLYPDATPGAAGSPLELTVMQGFTYNQAFQLDLQYGSFAAGSTVSATLWSSPSGAVLSNPTATWFTNGGAQTGYAQAQVALAIPGSQTSALDPAGEYFVNIVVTQTGSPIIVAQSRILISPAPGNAAPATPDLISADYCRGLLQSSQSLTARQIDAIPTLVTAASAAVRKFCARDFTQATYVEQVPVELNGTIRLREFPVNGISRIQCYPSVALTVTNTAAASAWVSQAFTGSIGDTLTITGMTLNWQDGGGTYSRTITYTSDMTIAGLASTIGAVGSGWVAVADPVLGQWPVTEIFDGTSSKGAGPNDTPDGAAEFNVYAENVTDARPHPDDGEKTGVWWIGRQVGPDQGPQWGPDWAAWDITNQPSTARVKVTYNGGYATVPYEVQLAVCELVKFQLDRLKTELLLQGEGAADYNYSISPNMIMAIPPHVMQALSRYRSTMA